ncbi:hypothetical protein FOXYSP1_04946 [Fusarium oxysporum f. sp. phaseoli]
MTTTGRQQQSLIQHGHTVDETAKAFADSSKRSK